jgi:glutamate--cysteine ligase
VHLVDESNSPLVTSEAELVAYFAGGAKPRAEFRVGTEHELVGVIARGGDDDGRAPGYDEPGGIGALMAWFAARGWTPVHERGHVIALTAPGAGGSQITLEPGGQFELAAAPAVDDRDFATELGAHVSALAEASRELGLAWLSTGIRPFQQLDEIPWMPKQRYDVMRAYMPRVGTRGLHMMLRTATVQTNLDFRDEADAAAKMRCLMSVTSVLTALWAASPIVGDEDTGRQSQRAWIWRDTDGARAGLLPLALTPDADADGGLFRRYTRWALDVPMYFVYRGGYVPCGDLTFRQFMAHGWQGQRATASDWALHLSTLFPDARLKRFIEVRGCDCGSLPMIAALGPMTRGLLYDDDAMAAATALTARLSLDEREHLAEDVTTRGLAARVGARPMLEVAQELVAIARAGLQRVAPAAVPLLAPVEEIAATGRTQADIIRERWHAAAPTRRARLAALAHPELAPNT